MIVFGLFDADVREAEDCKNDKDSAATKDVLCIEKVKHAAITAVSAAAVKAKILADQEEDQIRLLATLLVEKQVNTWSLQFSQLCRDYLRKFVILEFFVNAVAQVRN